MAGIDDELGVLGADAVAGGGVAEFLAVVGEEGGAPVGGFVAAGEFLEADAVHAGVGGESGEIEQGRGEVEVDDHFIDEFAFREEARVADDEGNAEAFLVERAFVAEPALAEEVAVVAGIDDDGVVGEFEFVERVQQSAEVFIDALDVAEVVEVDGVGGESAFLALVGLGERFVIDGGDVAVGGAAGGFAFVEVAQAVGEVVAAALVVRAFETDDHARTVVAWFCLEPVDGEVGADIVHPALGGGHHAVDFERAVLIYALVDEAGGVLEAGARAFLVAHVPFAEVGGAVSGVAQQGGVGDGSFPERACRCPSRR